MSKTASVLDDNPYKSHPEIPSNNPSSGQLAGRQWGQAIAAALAALPEAERAEIAAHVQALTRMSRRKRAVILRLARPGRRPPPQEHQSNRES